MPFTVLGPIPALIFILIVILAAVSGLPNSIQVRFSESTDITPPDDALSSWDSTVSSQVDSMKRIFTLSDDVLDSFRDASPTLPDLKLWFYISPKEGVDLDNFLTDVQDQENVDVAEIRPIPYPPPEITPQFQDSQDYLDPAPDGVDAFFSWTIPGGTGTDVTVFDIEYGWNQDHEDLSAVAGVTQLVNPGDSPQNAWIDHGTAVLGELVGDSNTLGVTGICHGADMGLAPETTTLLGNDRPNAIALATNAAKPGDVILLEMQTNVCGLGYGPEEWQQASFDAIQTAVANRIIVVEAAGNGGVDLDDPACNNKFDRSNRDSGAIIVGAGAPAGAATPRERLNFSSYGSRVDMQGWGDLVWTTGYGNTTTRPGYEDPDDVNNQNRWYTYDFGGTSSASPIVAGAAANLQGIANILFGTPILPFQMRILLRNTGTPQQGNLAEHIGPLPDIQAAYNWLTTGAVDLFFLVDVSGSFLDDIDAFKAQAPGIIQSIRDININTKFGLGTFSDYPISPFGGAAENDEAYVRNLDLTFDPSLVESAISEINITSPSAGKDLPESQLAALLQAASGEGQVVNHATGTYTIPEGQQASFRENSAKIIMLWTDAVFHRAGDPGDLTGGISYPGPTFVEVVSALEGLGIRRRSLSSASLFSAQVIGVSRSDDDNVLNDLRLIANSTGSVAGEDGVDCNGDGVIDVNAGQAIVCPSVTGEGIGVGIVAAVEASINSHRPVAQCAEIEETTDAGKCSASGVDVDGGSYDPSGVPLDTMIQAPPNPYSVGQTHVTLRVNNTFGLTDSCPTSVIVYDEELPVALCRDITVELDSDGSVEITPADVDAGSYDACVIKEMEISAFKFTCNDWGKENMVDLMVTDNNGNSNTCTSKVTVLDTIPPEPQCNATVEVTPPAAPISIQGTADDNCWVASLDIDNVQCFKEKNGKKKDTPCHVEVPTSDRITIRNTGGVDTHIAWELIAEDFVGNIQSVDCEVIVQNPGNGKGKLRRRD